MAEAALEYQSAPQFELRPLQAAILDASERFQVACLHRRYGKTVTAIEFCKTIVDDVGFPDPRAFFVFPFAKQAEEVAWDFLVAQTVGMAGRKLDKYRLEVSFKPRQPFGDVTGPKIKLLGSSEYHKHRGKLCDRVAFDETPDIPPPAWRQVFRPALADRRGKALFIGTPRGHDWFYDLFHDCDRLEHWRSHIQNVYQSGVIDPDEIKQLEDEMADNDFRQEFMCDWDVANTGAFYQRQINAALESDRVGAVPHNEDEPVDTSWWIDKSNTITVAFWQRSGLYAHCLEVIRELDHSITDVVREIKTRDYVYDRHYVPEWIDTDSQRWKAARQLGVRMQPVEAMLPIDVIELTRPKIAAMRFDDELAGDLVEAGRSYHANYDENRKCYSQDPVRDWSSEYAGALGVYARGFRPGRAEWSTPIDYGATNRPTVAA